ncbi:Glucose 1-dehydrogenase 3 [Eumeta japonica]|uniref:Glucose 1-dehydrogenase 3 n=1 Tax=Eumeta variegata TaxID=151549 RepID=A0A4C1WFA5_EUMVA|nr:Glucose 1-dehydrogenase 3 [Eumeta japonica]
MDFKNKVVLVTGGSSGIGRAIALHFSRQSAKIIIVGRNEDALKEVASACTKNSEHRAVYVKADVSKDADVERIVDVTRKSFGRLDVLVNNAGVFISDDIFTATAESFDAHINTNLRGTFNLTRLFVPLLIESKGNVINISGVEAVKYWEGLLTDSLSKVAIQHLTKYVAYELASKKVRSNSIALGYVVGTKIIERAGINPEEFGRDFVKSVPLGEFIKPEESRWSRSRSRERYFGAFTLAAGPDSSGTEYAADQSSEHSTPANSPRHYIKPETVREIMPNSYVVDPCRDQLGNLAPARKSTCLTEKRQHWPMGARIVGAPLRRAGLRGADYKLFTLVQRRIEAADDRHRLRGTVLRQCSAE